MTSVSPPRFSSRRVRSSMIVDVRAPALDVLGVPQRGRVAPPADDRGVGLHRRRGRGPSSWRLRAGGWRRPRVALRTSSSVGTTSATARIDRDHRRPAVQAQGRIGGRRWSAACAGAAGESRQEVDDGRRQDRQPRPGHQRRPEVVAADVGVDVRRGEEAGDRHGRPGQQRVARPRTAVAMNAIGMSGARIPNWVDGPRHQVAELARQLPERVGHAVAELLGQDDVLEPLPGVGRAVHERGTERPGAKRQLEVDEEDRERQHADARERRAGRGARSRVDREDVEPDRDRPAGSSGSGCRGRARRPRPPRPGSGRRGRRWSASGRRRRRPARTRSSQATSSHSRIATNARWSVCVSAWVAIAQAVGMSARPIPAAIPSTSRPVRRRTRSTVTAAATATQIAEKQVHQERRFAERLEDDRRQPADQHVRREPGRVGRAHERRDRLQLPGVPERDAGQEGERGGHEGDQPDQQRGGQARASHHPSNRLHMTPHRLMASDTTTRLIAPSMPQR